MFSETHLRHTHPAPEGAFIKHSASRAFTLIELLTVIAIIVILAAILIPVMGSVRNRADASQCVTNLRQIGVAASLYSMENNMSTAPPTSIRQLLPYLEEDYHTWICPSDERQKSETYTNGEGVGYSDCSYAYNARVVGLPPTYWEKSQSPILRIEEPSNTIYFADAKNYYMNTAKANQNAVARHAGKVNALFFDGSVRPIEYETPEDIEDFYLHL